MKLLIAASISALALSGAGLNLNGGARAFTGGAPAMELCVAGMNIAFGGATAVKLSMGQNGRCFCSDGCSTAALRIAGITLRL